MSEDIHKWTDGRYVLMFDEHTFFVFDNEKDDRMTALNVTKRLNEQEATIEQLRNSVEYWQKKYEEGTETFQISENDTNFQFNSNQAQLYTIKNVSPNGVVRLGNGHKAQWRMKDVREINAELLPFEDFNRETFMQMRNKFHKFDKDVFGRIIYNIYLGTFDEYI